MKTYIAVLLKPEDDDPHGLVHVAICGAWPPRAFTFHPTVGDPSVWHPVTTGSFCDDDNVALVLAWEGEVVAEGLVPLWKVGHSIVFLGNQVRGLLDGIPLTPSWPGTLILLDADGREVSS